MVAVAAVVAMLRDEARPGDAALQLEQRQQQRQHAGARPRGVQRPVPPLQLVPAVGRKAAAFSSLRTSSFPCVPTAASNCDLNEAPGVSAWRMAAACSFTIQLQALSSRAAMQMLYRHQQRCCACTYLNVASAGRTGG
jgi:septal ring-binding cell division protein DamX